MSLTIESVAVRSLTTATDGNKDIVMPHPSGLTAGDLMIAIVGATPEEFIPDISAPAGWTIVETNQGPHFTVAYKEADASDVSVGSSTFETGGFDEGGGVIYRITGTPASSFFDSGKALGAGNEASSSISFSPSIEAVGVDSHVFIVAYTNDSTSSGAISNYSLTGGASPTFTERVEDANSFSDRVLSIADGAYTSATDISAVSYDQVNGVNIDAQRAFCLIIYGQSDGNGSSTLLSVSPTFFSNTASVDTNGNSTLHSVSPTFGTSTGKGIVATNWQAENKPTTNWDNET